MVPVIEGKIAFARDQVVSSSQAGKNFGDMRRRARQAPVFVSDRNDGIDTVIIGFDEFERMAVELDSLRAQALYARAAGRAAAADANPHHHGIPAGEVMGDEAFARLVELDTETVPDEELFA